MNDKKVDGFRLIVEPSGKKRFGNGNRSRSNSRDKRSKNKRRRYQLYYEVLRLLQVHHPPQKALLLPRSQDHLLPVVKKKAGTMTKRKKVRNNSKSDWIEYSR